MAYFSSHPMIKALHRIWRFTKLMFKAFVEDNTFDLGAALAYYTIFSIIPLLVVVIAISGFVAGPDAVRGEVFQDLNRWVGADTAHALEAVVSNAYISGRSWVATVIGVITLVIGATGIFNALKNALNRMWEIQPKPKNTVVGFLISRLLSFSFVMGLGFLLIVTFTLNAAISGLSDDLARLIPGYAVLLVQIASWVPMFGISTLVFACVFKYLPHANIRWKDVLPGAVFTTCLFILGKYILTLYFDSKAPTSTFGAAAGLISLLLWTFYSSQTFFLGAEFVYVWCEERGRPIRPRADAVRVVRQEVTIDRGHVVSKESKQHKLEEVRKETPAE